MKKMEMNENDMNMRRDERDMDVDANRRAKDCFRSYRGRKTI